MSHGGYLLSLGPLTKFTQPWYFSQGSNISRVMCFAPPWPIDLSTPCKRIIILNSIIFFGRIFTHERPRSAATVTDTQPKLLGEFMSGILVNPCQRDIQIAQRGDLKWVRR